MSKKFYKKTKENEKSVYLNQIFLLFQFWVIKSSNKNKSVSIINNKIEYKMSCPEKKNLVILLHLIKKLRNEADNYITIKNTSKFLRLCKLNIGGSAYQRLESTYKMYLSTFITLKESSIIDFLFKQQKRKFFKGEIKKIEFNIINEIVYFEKPNRVRIYFNEIFSELIKNPKYYRDIDIDYIDNEEKNSYVKAYLFFKKYADNKSGEITFFNKKVEYLCELLEIGNSEPKVVMNSLLNSIEKINKSDIRVEILNSEILSYEFDEHISFNVYDFAAYKKSNKEKDKTKRTNVNEDKSDYISQVSISLEDGDILFMVKNKKYFKIEGGSSPHIRVSSGASWGKGPIIKAIKNGELLLIDKDIFYKNFGRDFLTFY